MSRQDDFLVRQRLLEGIRDQAAPPIQTDRRDRGYEITPAQYVPPRGLKIKEAMN